jgi:ribonuclease-3
MARLETAIGHHFAQPALLVEAMTHASLKGETGEQPYDRLEFLGDAVLGLLTAEMLYSQGESEGDLSRRRAALVNTASLAGLGRRLNLGSFLRLGQGAVQSGVGENESILADAVEALLGAVYLDGGLKAARRVAQGLLAPLLSGPGDSRDPKSTLQEGLQALGLPPPDYVVVARTGPPHAPRFAVEARQGGRILGRGEGNSKRHAEREAAQAALDAASGQDGMPRSIESK